MNFFSIRIKWGSIHLKGGTEYLNFIVKGKPGITFSNFSPLVSHYMGAVTKGKKNQVLISPLLNVSWTSAMGPDPVLCSGNTEINRTQASILKLHTIPVRRETSKHKLYFKGSNSLFTDKCIFRFKWPSFPILNSSHFPGPELSVETHPILS